MIMQRFTQGCPQVQFRELLINVLLQQSICITLKTCCE